MAIPQTHILVVDDHPELMQEMLPAYGYRITVARDGREALAVIETPENRFDLILLDVMMPYVNGWDVLRRIRAMPEKRNTPIILLTALDSDMDQVSGLKIGADDYIAKPFKIQNLLARIEAILRRSRWTNRSLIENRGAVEGMTPISRVGKKGVVGEEGKAPEIQPLTEREREILGLVAQGMSNREIAEHLVVSELTIKTHLKNLFKKLNVSSRTQAILVGMQHNLIASPS